MTIKPLNSVVVKGFLSLPPLPSSSLIFFIVLPLKPLEIHRQERGKGRGGEEAKSLLALLCCILPIWGVSQVLMVKGGFLKHYLIFNFSFFIFFFLFFFFFFLGEDTFHHPKGDKKSKRFGKRKMDQFLHKIYSSF